MTYQPLPLACDPQRLSGLSEKLVVSHYENNYCGAVRRLNIASEQIQQLNWSGAPAYLVNGLKREQLLTYNSMVLHELYFDGLGESGRPPAPLLSALERDFGSFDRWSAEFAATGKSMPGTGWVLLAYCPRERRLLNQWASDHTQALAGATPILAMDVYEHSYHIDYGAKAAADVDAYMQNIRWNHVATRLASCVTPS
ncbi:MAG: superoxide dismutase [Ramlibacter sp.]|nr:superoxide dismutase [Ramlibacter sp.]